MRGRVKWFNEAKGYGFITPDDKSSDVFVHYSAIEGRGFRTLTSGQRVEFDPDPSPRRGPAATRVAPVNTD